MKSLVRRLSHLSLEVLRVTRRCPMNLHAIGIDLGKTVFHLVGLSQLASW